MKISSNMPLIIGLIMILSSIIILMLLGKMLSRNKTRNAENRLSKGHKQNFESLLMDVFAKLINISVDKIDSSINEALGIIAEYEKADTAFITLCFENGKIVDSKYQWFAEGIPNYSNHNCNVKVDDFPILVKKIVEEGAIIINDINEISLQAESEIEYLKNQGIKSLIMIPLYDKEDLIGYLGFGTIRMHRHWSNDIIRLLKVIGITLANIIIRKRADEALRESEQRFRSLAMLSPDTIAVIQNGEIVFINEAGLNLLGISNPGEILGRNPLDFVHPEHLEAIRKQFALAGQSAMKPKYAEHILVKPDGREIVVETASTAMTYQGQHAIQAVGRDITERKRMENDLREQKDLFLSMFRNHRSIMYMVDPLTLRITDANHAAEKFYGYPRKTLIGMSLCDLNVMSEREIKDEILKAGRENRDYYIYKHKLADGRIKDVEVRSTPIMTHNTGQVYFTIVNDITDRMEALEALRQSEERYRSLQNNVPVGLFRTNEAGRILSVNAALVEIMRASSEEELCKANLLDIYADPSIRSGLIGKLNRDGHLDDLELELRRMDNTHMWALLSVRTAYGKDGRPDYYDASLRDITIQKQAQEALKASEETYRNLFQNAQVGLFRTRIEDGKTLECNDQIARMFGYKSRHEAINHYFTKDKYIDPEARDKMLALLKSKGEFSNFEAELIRIDGGIVWIRFSARIYPQKGWIEGVAEDITQQKRVEIAIQKSEKKFKELADLLPMTIFEIDINGDFRYVNKFGLEFSGYTEEDLHKGINLFQLFSPEEEDKVKRNLQMRFSGQEPPDNEYKMTLKDGSIAYTSVYASVIMQDNAPVGLRGVVVDLTEKKLMQDFLIQAQRLETAGRIAGQVAHDFNNLLGPLVAYPDLIMDDLPPDHPIIPLIEDIRSSAQQLSEINQQLLTLGRRGHYNQEPINLNKVIEHVLAQIFPLPPSLKIQTELEHDLMNMMGGESQIMRIISNLVTNARDAMHDIGLLTISTVNVDLSEPCGKWGQIPEGQYVKLTVSDTGCGISSEVLPKIFDPFFTTKKADRKKGSGLGLSTVFAVVEDHHGYIDCRTQVGKGTSFDLYFPITLAQKLGTNEEMIIGGNEKILIVDDDQAQRSVCMNLLRKLGYYTAAVENGQKAIEYLKIHEVDLLILDVIISEDMDGVETYRRILEINPCQKAIVASGYAESEKIRNVLELGAVSVIQKPMTLKSIARAVREALDQAKTTSAITD